MNRASVNVLKESQLEKSRRKAIIANEKKNKKYQAPVDMDWETTYVNNKPSIFVSLWKIVYQYLQKLFNVTAVISTKVFHWLTKKENKPAKEQKKKEKSKKKSSSQLTKNLPQHSNNQSNQINQSISLEAHAMIPYIISGYLQLLFNLGIILCISYLGAQFYITISQDVDIKIEEYSMDILNEIELCSKNYLENRCSPEDRIPAMQKTCTTWETCMNRDPTVVGRAKVSAETIAGIINSFLEPISYKTMVFFTVFVFGFTILCNAAFYLSSFSVKKKINEQNFSQDNTAKPSAISTPLYYSNNGAGPNLYLSPIKH